MTKSTPVRVVAPLLVAALTACSGSSSGMLVDLAPIDAGDDCANGGLMIQTGVDANDDGVLGADEVSSTEFVCDGEAGAVGQDGDDGAPGGAGAVLRQTGLDEGDANCPFGGTQFDAGIDDGTPSGIANDGILQDGEVDSTEYVCSGNPNSSGGAPISPPDGEVGPYSLMARGGEGLTLGGGVGGDVEVRTDSGTNGGGVRIYATGEADADWDFPTDITVFLGDNPLIITADTTISTVVDTAGLSSGDRFIDATGRLRSFDGDANPEFTGLHIGPGATLTLEPAAGDSGVDLTLAFDLFLEGTLTTGLSDEAERADLGIILFNFIGAPTGAIDLTGVVITDGRRGIGSNGNGGSFEMYPYTDLGAFLLDSGSVWNQSTINTSGADGVVGGNAGELAVVAAHRAYNSADLTARGGEGTGGDGGDGARIRFESDYSNTYNSGVRDASGGNASGGDGGDGGDLWLTPDLFGDVRNTGDFISNGGDASCSSACTGGGGGRLEWDVSTQSFSSSGDISLRGGAGLRTGGGVESVAGGHGGSIEVTAETEEGYAFGEDIPAGSFAISGNWDVSGGDGDMGGDAGDIDVQLDADHAPDRQLIVFYGYNTLDVGGGDGVDDGGDGGTIELYSDYAESHDYPFENGPGGSVANFADADVSGGDSSTGSGGDGGYFHLYTEAEYGWDADWLVAVNHGDIDASGGNGTSENLHAGNDGVGGGDGGSIVLFGMAGVTNVGELLATGGDGYNGGCGGCQNTSGWLYGVFVLSDNGDVANSGDIVLHGGDALSPFGDGGGSESVEMVGRHVVTSGLIDASGGDGGSDDGTGGHQDEGVNVLSLYGVTDFTGAFIDVSGGDGAELGEGGVAVLDGENVTDALAPVATTR